MNRFLEWLEEKLYHIPNTRDKIAFAKLFAYPVAFLYFVVILIVTNWQANIKPIKSYFSPNKISVKTTDGLNIDSVRITWNLEYFEPVTIYKNRKTVYSGFKEPGENVFILYYGIREVGSFIHEKQVDWKGYDYSFLLSKKDSCIITSLRTNNENQRITWIKNMECESKKR